MARLQSRLFDEPDEFVTLPLVTVQVVLLGEVHVARLVHQPGWSWAEHVKPVAGTPSCQHHHQGVVLEGAVAIETDAGARRILRAGEAFEIPPGHNARVIGDQPFVTIEFAGVHGWAKPAEAGERFVATLLVTDIVDSTKVAVQLGDAAWTEALARHNEGVRILLDRFRGVEVYTTGDGFLAFLTARHEPCGVRQRSAMACCRMASRSAPASIRAKSSATPEASAASRYTLSLASQPWPTLVTYSFQRRRRACSKAPAFS
jgi:quercetin dioxygenase-like cupin family protein